MVALPTTTVAFASSATEADFKTFLSGQRDYLAALLGTDGLPATARAALGVNAKPVRSDGTPMNFIWSAHAALSYYWGSSDGVNMYPVAGSSISVGYASNCATISGLAYNGLPYVLKDIGYNAIGSIVVGIATTSQIGIVQNSTYAGVSTGIQGAYGIFYTGSTGLAGTWRAITGQVDMGGGGKYLALFQRIS